MISFEDAGCLLQKLISESIPVIAFFAATDGSHMKLSGFIDSISGEGLIISSKRGEFSSFINVPIGADCEYAYGDKREIPEHSRERLSEQYGECALTVSLPSGFRLILLFDI